MNNEQLLLAQTIYGEARGEGRAGMEAVANVIMNRVRASQWPNTVEGVIKQPLQFSVWNDMSAANTRTTLTATIADPYFQVAWDVAALALKGTLPDNTGGATNYHTLSVSPSWANSSQITATIGNHVFYDLG